MSNAFNLSQLANNTNSTGQVSLTAGVTGTLPIANGGTNSTATATAGGVGYGTGTANAYTAAGTSGQALISAAANAPSFGTLGVSGGGTGLTSVGTSGYVMTSNGSAFLMAAAAGGSAVNIYRQVFASSGSWTAPTGVTKVIVWASGGGSGGVRWGGGITGIPGGLGGQGVAIVTVTPGTTYTITIGAGTNAAGISGCNGGTSTAGGTTSFSSLVTATGGTSSAYGPGYYTGGTQGTFTTTGTYLNKVNSQSAFTGIATNTSSTNVAYNPSATNASYYTAGAAGDGGGNCSIGAYGYGGTGGAVLIQYVG
jgi:hypothetical protein